VNVHHVLVFAVTSTTNLQLAKTLINIMKEAKKEANYMSERHPEEANHRLEQTKSPLCSSKRQHKEKKKTQMIPGKRKPRRQPRKEKNSN
jgi:vacuolar-type H+-ATPase subunit E/Vma4